MKGLLKEPFGCALCKKLFSDPMDLPNHYYSEHSPKSNDSKSPQKSVNKNEDSQKSCENDPKIGLSDPKIGFSDPKIGSSNDDSGISSSNETKSPDKEPEFKEK